MKKMLRKLNIDDVARHCGVSRATVDRVINKRGGVRSQTVEIVEAAIRELGYSTSALASHSASKVIKILLSQGTNPLFSELERVFSRKINAFAENCEITMGGFDPYQPGSVAAALKAVPPEVTSIIMVGVDMPAVVAEINSKVENGARVITVLSDVTRSKRHTYIGQDNFIAGQTAGRLMSTILGPIKGSVAILVGHNRFRHLLDRQSGFTNSMALHCPDIVIRLGRPYGGDDKVARSVVEEVIAENPDLRGVYLTGSGQPSIMQSLGKFRSTGIAVIGHEVTTESRLALSDGRLGALIAHDLDELADEALRASLDTTAEKVINCKVNIYVEDNLPVV